MKRITLLGIFFALGAATLSAADDVASVQKEPVVAPDDDMAEFLRLATQVLDNAAADGDDAPAALDTDARLRPHLGLGFAQGLDTDPTGLYTDNCRGNGHSGVFINGLGYRDCGDPSPSD